MKAIAHQGTCARLFLFLLFLLTGCSSADTAEAPEPPPPQQGTAYYLQKAPGLPIGPDLRLGGVYKRVYLDSDIFDADAIVKGYLKWGILIGFLGLVLAVLLRKYSIPCWDDIALIAATVLAVSLFGLWWYEWIKAIVTAGLCLAAAAVAYAYGSKFYTKLKLKREAAALTEVVATVEGTKDKTWIDGAKDIAERLQSAATKARVKTIRETLPPKPERPIE